MTIQFWDSGGTRLFHLGDPPVNLRYSSVKSIVWPDHGENKGMITLEASMPRGIKLLRFRNGDDLALIFGECQDPNEFREDEIIFRFHNCQVKRKWIMRPQTLFLGEREEIRLRLLLECEIGVFGV